MFFSVGYGAREEGAAIPFRVLGHLMTVTVGINDSPKEFNFVVDTGGAIFVSKDVADDLGLKQMGPQAKITMLHLPGLQNRQIFFVSPPSIFPISTRCSYPYPRDHRFDAA